MNRHQRNTATVWPALLATIAIVAVLITGCATGAANGPTALSLAPDPATVERDGYSASADSVTYEDDSLRVTVHPVAVGVEARNWGRREGTAASADGGADEDAATRLTSMGYLVFEAEVVNRSATRRIIYKPSFTALHTSHLDYGRALDFTDLYDIIGVGASGSMQQSFGAFYDLDVTLMPGESVKKFLAFRPLTERASTVDVEFNDIYVGTETRDVTFRFTADEAEDTD